MYPILRDSAIIKRREYACWVMDSLSGFNQVIAPATATMLALCTGSMTSDEIIDMCAPIFEIDREECAELFNIASEVLAWYEEPLDLPQRYAPTEFMYYPKRMPMERHGRMDKPVELLFGLTHRCNFRCIYCFNASGTPEQNREMSTEEWLDIIKQAAELDVGRITLTGGEPLLHPGIEQIVRSIAERGMDPFICTNGSLITPKFVDMLKELDIKLVQVSMDSADDALCDALTQRTGSRECISCAIKLLVDAGIGVIVKAVLMPDTLSGVPRMISHLESLGAKKLVLERFDISSCGRGSTDMLITDEDIDELRRCVKEYREAHPELKLLINITNNRLKWRDESDAVNCGALKSIMLLMPNGDVSICEKMVDVPEATVGNFKTQSLMDVWESPRVCEVLFPDESRYDETCLSCGMFPVCRAGCYSLKRSLGQDMYGIDPRCHLAKQEGE